MAVVFASYKDSIAFNPARFNPVALAQSDKVRVLLVCLEPGQFIPVHQPGVDMLLLVLEGEGLAAVGKQDTKVGPGAVVFVKTGEVRGLKAQSRFVSLHVVVPPPNEADHREVMAGLDRGSWR